MKCELWWRISSLNPPRGPRPRLSQKPPLCRTPPVANQWWKVKINFHTLKWSSNPHASPLFNKNLCFKVMILPSLFANAWFPHTFCMIYTWPSIRYSWLFPHTLVLIYTWPTIRYTWLPHTFDLGLLYTWLTFRCTADRHRDIVWQQVKGDNSQPGPGVRRLQQGPGPTLPLVAVDPPQTGGPLLQTQQGHQSRYSRLLQKQNWKHCLGFIFSWQDK